MARPILAVPAAALLMLLAACGEDPGVEVQPVPTRKGAGGRTVFDHSLFDDVLSRSVDEKGMVDYAGLEADSGDLDRYVGQLAAASPKTHPDLFPTQDHQIAYWINAYNAMMLRIVVDHYPVGSPLEIGLLPHSVFRSIEYRLGGERMSLDDVEKGVLLADYDEPRVHFALTCASMSCPRLGRRAFDGEDLDARLDQEARAFLGRPEGLEIDEEANVVRLSKYFEWYGDDFQPDPLTFVRPYLDEDRRRRIEGLDDPRIEFLDYDWRLNDAGAEWAP